MTVQRYYKFTKFVMSSCTLTFPVVVIPMTTIVTYSDRSFVATATKLWNLLPLTIRQSNYVQ